MIQQNGVDPLRSCVKWPAPEHIQSLDLPRFVSKCKRFLHFSVNYPFKHDCNSFVLSLHCLTKMACKTICMLVFILYFLEVVQTANSHVSTFYCQSSGERERIVCTIIFSTGSNIDLGLDPFFFNLHCLTVSQFPFIPKQLGGNCLLPALTDSMRAVNSMLERSTINTAMVSNVTLECLY